MTEQNLCPNLDNIFKAFELTDVDKTKVVILGLDPYKNGEAHGLSFSCESGKVPPSLRIIFKELVACGIHDKPRTSANLTDWAEQGVLLLNTVLTTVRGETLAHSDWGWQHFTSKVIEHVSSKGGAVFMLWGKAAQGMRKHIDEEYNLILESCHPAAQLYGGRNQFVGNDHFVKANEWAEESIQW